MSAAVSEAVRIVACHLPIPECPDSVAIPVTITARDLRLIYAALQEESGALPASPSGDQGSSPMAIPTEPLEPLLADLEQKALAAPSREWVSSYSSDDDEWRVREVHAGLLVADLSPANFTIKEDARHAAFIAAANPATVLKLIAAVRAREVGMEAFAEGRNAPQPSPEPRDREEG